MDFLQRLLSPEGADFLSKWGWAILIPIGIGILWRVEASRTSAAVAQRDFKAACDGWLYASSALKDEFQQGGEAWFKLRRLERRFGRVVETALKALPEMEREEMRRSMKEAGLDYVKDITEDENTRREIDEWTNGQPPPR